MGHNYIKDYCVRAFLVESGKDLGPVPNATKRMAALPPHMPRGTRALSPLAAAVPSRPQSNRCAAVRLRRRHHAGPLREEAAIARTKALRSRPASDGAAPQYEAAPWFNPLSL